MADDTNRTPEILAQLAQRALTAFRGSGYKEYLQSAWWRRRRHDRIQKAGSKCEYCHARTELQVHHVRYDRIAAELDTDLEVLCRRCHEELHHDESRQQNLGVYLVLAREAARFDRPETFADWKDAIRERCRQLTLIPNEHRIDDAISAMEGQLRFVSDERREELARMPDPPPIGKEEAHDLVRRLGITVPFKEIPRVPQITQFQADRAKVLQMIMGEILTSIQQCEQLERHPPPRLLAAPYRGGPHSDICQVGREIESSTTRPQWALVVAGGRGGNT